MHLFEYAVLRVVPRVEREEFLNVGVIVLLPGSQGFLQATCALDEARLHGLRRRAPRPARRATPACAPFERICRGQRHGRPHRRSCAVAARFRWLTATRSTVVQTSPVHPGLCDRCRRHAG
ncbi:MAG: DUF3037 domain-containing protein [Hymenobacter sp.]